MTSTCPVCRSGDVRVVTAPRQVDADDGTRLEYTDALTQCAKCGERFYTHEQAMASSRARAGALRTYEHLLTPEDIRTLRRRFGLSQAALEKLLGVGAKTVVRWERGTVCQNGAVDRLMRVVSCYGPAALECARVSVVAVDEPAVVPVVPGENLLMNTLVTATSRGSGSWHAIQVYGSPSAAVEVAALDGEPDERQPVLAA